MTRPLRKQDIQIAYSMIETAKRIRARRDGSHLFQSYFLFWTAFNNIYTAIANMKGIRTQIKMNSDGSIITITNGSVNIPEVLCVTEKEQIYLSLKEFKDDLKDSLIHHKGTEYFVNRIPYWQGKPIEYDMVGQIVNGVLNINYTISRQYPVWSPIDVEYYREYLENPQDIKKRDFLCGQILDLLYTVRNNLMHGSKEFDDAVDLKVIENALPMLEIIVMSFLQSP